PGGTVNYEGDARIDGVPGSAAPIDLQFMETVGSMTSGLFPTGARKEVVEGVEVSCMDVAMPMVIARATDFGLTGYETAEALDQNTDLMARMENVRKAAGERMGMGDVTKSVTPKFGILAPPRDGGSAAVRYFMPWNCHPTLAVTGAQCISASLLCPGTVGEGIGSLPEGSPAELSLEHPMGQLLVTVDFTREGDAFEVHSAGLVRTARKLAAGEVFVPSNIWAGP
ncbi:MAG: PrpF domain-containing protein, partial [Pseudomonadota bacterium]